MDLLLILTYAALAYSAFRFLGIPVNKWTVPTAVLGGVVMIALILLFMGYNHPFTPMGRFYFASVPIVPEVEGRVIEVVVQPNVPVKQGDVLFKIDPAPYQYVLDQKRAALAEAEQGVLQLKAALDSAVAKVDEITAERDRAKAQYDRYEEANRLAGKGAAPFSVQQVENQRQLWLAKDAELVSTRAKAEEARLAYSSQIGRGEHHRRPLTAASQKPGSPLVNLRSTADWLLQPKRQTTRCRCSIWWAPVPWQPAER